MRRLDYFLQKYSNVVCRKMRFKTISIRYVGISRSEPAYFLLCNLRPRMPQYQKGQNRLQYPC